MKVYGRVIGCSRSDIGKYEVVVECAEASAMGVRMLQEVELRECPAGTVLAESYRMYLPKQEDK